MHEGTEGDNITNLACGMSHGIVQLLAAGTCHALILFLCDL